MGNGAFNWNKAKNDDYSHVFRFVQQIDDNKTPVESTGHEAFNKNKAKIMMIIVGFFYLFT